MSSQTLPTTRSSAPRRPRRVETVRRLDLAELPADRLKRMAAAGEEVLTVQAVLARTQDNVVGEILRHQGTFFEWNHYPKGDIYDGQTHAQYFYHSHGGGERDAEHGHFHTFLRAAGMPSEVCPAKRKHSADWPKGEDALTHIVGISMDIQGLPLRLFAANRWVTGETWYRAEDVIGLIDRFAVEHAQPSWPANRWVSAMVHLFWPQVVTLLRARDATVAAWQRSNPGTDVLEDRRLEVTSQVAISVDGQIRAVRAALEANGIAGRARCRPRRRTGTK
jgi:hypothetical protein